MDETPHFFTFKLARIVASEKRETTGGTQYVRFTIEVEGDAKPIRYDTVTGPADTMQGRMGMARVQMLANACRVPYLIDTDQLHGIWFVLVLGVQDKNEINALPAVCPWSPPEPPEARVSLTESEIDSIIDAIGYRKHSGMPQGYDSEIIAKLHKALNELEDEDDD